MPDALTQFLSQNVALIILAVVGMNPLGLLTGGGGGGKASHRQTLTPPPAPSRRAALLPDRLTARLRTLTPSIVVRIHVGHPVYPATSPC